MHAGLALARRQGNKFRIPFAVSDNRSSEQRKECLLDIQTFHIRSIGSIFSHRKPRRLLFKSGCSATNLPTFYTLDTVDLDTPRSLAIEALSLPSLRHFATSAF